MADQKKLDRWADKLLDTGKRNNLISFKDPKTSSAEIVSSKDSHLFQWTADYSQAHGSSRQSTRQDRGQPHQEWRMDLFSKYRHRL